MHSHDSMGKGGLTRSARTCLRQHLLPWWLRYELRIHTETPQPPAHAPTHRVKQEFHGLHAAQKHSGGKSNSGGHAAGAWEMHINEQGQSRLEIQPTMIRVTVHRDDGQGCCKAAHVYLPVTSMFL